MNNSAIACTVKELFQNFNRDSFTDACKYYVNTICKLPVSKANCDSWKDCYDYLEKAWKGKKQFEPFHVLFEYKMPGANQRADVILLAKKKVIIFEFKMKYENSDKRLNADVFQTINYKSSIENFHKETDRRNMEVTSYLTFTKGKKARDTSVPTLFPDDFEQKTNEFIAEQLPMNNTEVQQWINSPFRPLKNIIEATNELFENGNIPTIRTVKKQEIDNCLNSVNKIISNNKNQKNIIFIAGVPGSGKTLVGLQTVYDHIVNINNQENELLPIYLTGNRPLANVLQQTLSSDNKPESGKAFIRELSDFKTNYTSYPTNLVVFDEAQRAWDGENGRTSEPQLLVKICDDIAKKYGRITLICLIGEGQEIARREEQGLSLWPDSLRYHSDWNIFIPQKYKDAFKYVYNVKIDNNLFLDTSIRNDFINVSPWVESLLHCDFKKAKRQYIELKKQGFKVAIIHNPEMLPQIIENVQNNYPYDHTGLISSSHDPFKYNNFDKEIFGSQYSGSNIFSNNIYNWFVHDSVSLKQSATEYDIQGLELEWPIVTFTGDYYLKKDNISGTTKWEVNPKAKNINGLHDASTVLRNVYRVLLTRSRKGMYIYIPKKIHNLDETNKILSSIINIY